MPRPQAPRHAHGVAARLDSLGLPSASAVAGGHPTGPVAEVGPLERRKTHAPESPSSRLKAPISRRSRADGGTRTRILHVGNVALSPLSFTRESPRTLRPGLALARRGAGGAGGCSRGGAHGATPGSARTGSLAPQRSLPTATTARPADRPKAALPLGVGVGGAVWYPRDAPSRPPFPTTATAPPNGGGRIRTDDLRVMGPARTPLLHPALCAGALPGPARPGPPRRPPADARRLCPSLSLYVPTKL